MPFLSDNQYLAIKPETAPGVAVLPTEFVPLMSTNLRTVVNYIPDRRMKGLEFKANDLLRGNRMHEGEVVVLGDPDTLGHFLNMVMLKGASSGNAGDGFTHPFTVGDPQTYTFEIKKGEHVERYIGVLIDELKIEFNDNQMQLTVAVKALASFSVATLGIALSSGTTTVLDDKYDINPTRGLVVGDVLSIDGNDATILTIDADGVTITHTESITAVLGSTVFLKPQTSTLATLTDPFYFGNLFVGFGADEAAATIAAGDRATATPIYDLVITLRNNLFTQNGSNRLDPVQILTRTKEAQVELKQLFEDSDQRQAWLDREKQALTIIANGLFIKSDFSTKELFTLTLNRVKLIENETPLEIGEFIFYDQQFEVLDDAGDGQAMDVVLVNRTDGSEY